jgi:dTDP-4-amino-4,6-dideoxygalactose transaminase
LDLGPGDEVIFPSFTFVSTANAFILRGVKAVFADSLPHHPNIDPQAIRDLITPKTKALVIVHYGGAACAMEEIMKIVQDHNLYLIEDAAHAIDSYYKDKPLGSFGHLATFSFHETKNIICGEGGMLVINDPRFEERAEILWEKGTNRTAFFRGEVDKYGWVDLGSSFLPSDLTAAFLMAQLECLADIQSKRKSNIEIYYKGLDELIKNALFQVITPDVYATQNGHLFAIVLADKPERTALIKHLKQHDIYPAFHYQSLHKSPFFTPLHDGRALPNADLFSERLLRLPVYHDLNVAEIQEICNAIKGFYEGRQA